MLADLVAQLARDPDDLDARSVYADAIGGERGEAIALEVELARAGLADLDAVIDAPIVGDDLRRAIGLHRRIVELRGHTGALRVTIYAPSDVDALAVLRDPSVWIDELTIAHAALPAVAASPVLERVRALRVEVPDLAACASLAAILDRLTRLRALALTDVADPAVAVAAVARAGVHPALAELALERATDRALAALAATPLAGRLRSLAITGWQDDPAPLRAPLAPIAELAGAFPQLAAFTVLGVDGIAVPARGVIAPARFAVSGLAISSLRALLPALAPVRDLALDLGADERLDEVVPLAALAAAAPALEALALEVEATTPPLDALAGLAHLRRFRLATSQVLAAHDLAPIVVERALAHLALDGRRVAPDALAAIAREPDARSLRSLALARVPIGDAALRVFAASPHVARLRALALHRTDPIGARGLDAIAQLRELVRLVVDRVLPGNGDPPALAGHPALVACELVEYRARAVRRIPRTRLVR